jgi:hypothetical protein
MARSVPRRVIKKMSVNGPKRLKTGSRTRSHRDVPQALGNLPMGLAHEKSKVRSYHMDFMWSSKIVWSCEGKTPTTYGSGDPPQV